MSTENAETTVATAADWRRLYADDRFTFRCGPDLDCYRSCCRDVNIVLTPYDIVRLKRALRITSSDFLEQFTYSIYKPDQQKFPLVILKMEGQDNNCPFLYPSGCSVYPDRPWACRMYPLGCAEPKTPSPTDRAFHFVIREDLCHGHGQGAERTVRAWLEDQQTEEFEVMNTPFKALTVHDYWHRSTELSDDQSAMFYTACYDVDKFRSFVFETRFLQLFDVDEARVAAIRDDDEELLEFAIEWLRFVLFHDKTMRMRIVPERGAE